jgi:hypothetical protein
VCSEGCAASFFSVVGCRPSELSVSDERLVAVSHQAAPMVHAPDGSMSVPTATTRG